MEGVIHSVADAFNRQRQEGLHSDGAEQLLKHLLLFGWHAEGTGFTRVLREVLPHLARHYRITWMGVGYKAGSQ